MGKRIKLEKTIYLTGGANEILMNYKRKMFPGFEIVVKENCSLQGLAYMARETLSMPHQSLPFPFLHIFLQLANIHFPFSKWSTNRGPTS